MENGASETGHPTRNATRSNTTDGRTDSGTFPHPPVNSVARSHFGSGFVLLIQPTVLARPRLPPRALEMTALNRCAEREANGRSGFFARSDRMRAR